MGTRRPGTSRQGQKLPPGLPWPPEFPVDETVSVKTVLTQKPVSIRVSIPETLPDKAYHPAGALAPPASQGPADRSRPSRQASLWQDARPPARSPRAALSEAAAEALGRGGGLWGRPDPGFKAQLHCTRVAPTSKLEPASWGTRRAGVADATGCLRALFLRRRRSGGAQSHRKWALPTRAQGASPQVPACQAPPSKAVPSRRGWGTRVLTDARPDSVSSWAAGHAGRHAAPEPHAMAGGPRPVAQRPCPSPPLTWGCCSP